MKTLTGKEWALYLGCEAEIQIDKSNGVLKPLRGIITGIKYNHDEIWIGIERDELGQYFWPAPSIKLILRPLSEAPMELIKTIAQRLGCSISTIISLTVGLTEYLSVKQAAIILNEFRQAGYDCDNWIEQGLAIDATKVPTP